MFKNISIYSVVGLINTCLHWCVFYGFNANGLNQSYSNLIAFICAATFSFFINARFNFRVEINKTRYFLFIFGMGIISFTVGEIADYLMLSPLITLISFSGLSFILGFAYTKYLVFR